jgi:hypothetical protein
VVGRQGKHLLAADLPVTLNQADVLAPILRLFGVLRLQL